MENAISRNSTLHALNVQLLHEPNNIKAIKERAALKYSFRDHKGALEDLNRADKIEPNDALTLCHRGDIKRMLGHFKGALEDLNRADEIKPNDAYILHRRGAVKLQLADDHGALEDLNRANEMEPDNAYTLHFLGEAKRMLGDYEGAFRDLNRADEIEPNSAVILKCRGATKQILGDDQGALEDLNRADEIEPNNAFTLRYRGATKLILCDYEGALEDLNRADEIQPNELFTLYHRGATKRMLGDYEGALEDSNKADKIKPHGAFTLQHRAIVRYYLMDFSRALEDIMQAFKYHPNNTNTVEWKNKIEDKIKQINMTMTKINTPDQMKLNKGQKPKSPVSVPTVVQEGVIQVPFSELKVIKTLGEGGFGEVSLAEWNGSKVAFKKFKSNVVVDDMFHEAKTLILFRHKCIVTLTGVSTDPATNNTILIMEYMKHGSLYDLLFKEEVKLSHSEVIRLALDIALGVNYLHSHKPKVLHRDLKSSNVLLYCSNTHTRAKIADFGSAKFLHANVQAETIVGNPSIAMPPEMLAEEPYDEKVDVFAFGVVLYEMLTNKRLGILEESHRVKRIRKTIDGPLLQLVLNCCSTDPTKRPHMRDIIELLRMMKTGLN